MYVPNIIFSLLKGGYGQYLANNALHSIYTHVCMDVHLWIEHTHLTENDTL